MTSGHTEPGSEPGWRIIEAAVRSARGHLGDALLSAYAIGSLAHGGFREWVSDVDLALLTDDRTGLGMADVVEQVASNLAGRGELGGRLSVFHAPWVSFGEPPAEARFPPIDRYDLVHYGVLIDGTDLRRRYARAPAPREIREQAVDSALRRLTRPRLERDVDDLVTGRVTVRGATKLVLWPVRLEHVCDTGAATGNAEAVAHYARRTEARHGALVREALGWRERGVIADPTRALSRIRVEIADLHAEIFERLGEDGELPRQIEIRERAHELGGE